MDENQKQKYFCGQNYKWINNSDGTTCLKGWIKIRISLASSYPMIEIVTLSLIFLGHSDDMVVSDLFWCWPLVYKGTPLHHAL